MMIIKYISRIFLCNHTKKMFYINDLILSKIFLLFCFVIVDILQFKKKWGRKSANSLSNYELVKCSDGIKSLPVCKSEHKITKKTH